MIDKGGRGHGPARKACTWCSAQLVWAPDPSGARVALDAEPTTDGTVVLYPRAGQPDMAVTLTRAAATAHRASGWPTYRRHDTTCPYARQWSTAAAAAVTDTSGTGRLRALICREADALAAAGHQPIPTRDGRVDLAQAARASVQLATAGRLRAIADHPCAGASGPGR